MPAHFPMSAHTHAPSRRAAGHGLAGCARHRDAHRPQGRAAFFDLDKTLIPGSSLYQLAKGLHANDMMNFKLVDMVRFGWGQAAFRLRGEKDKDLGRSRRASLDLVAGRSQEELRAWCAEIAGARIVPRVYQGMAQIIRHHQERGDATVLVTAAPVELAETMADQLGLTGAIGTAAEVVDGRYTGNLPGPVLHGAEKARAVAERAGQLHLSLPECSAYSDSINDLPLLELVGHPHAVNPARQLRQVAGQRGWPVHEMRRSRRKPGGRRPERPCVGGQPRRASRGPAAGLTAPAPPAARDGG